MVSLAGIGGSVASFALTWGFWLLFFFFVLLVSIGSLYLRKKAKFMYPAVIFIDNGNGKVGLRYTKAGWFKSQKILGGLFDIGGEKRLEIQDGRTVQQGSTRDFHEINYHAGLLLREKADDPKVLVPLDKCELTTQSRRLLMEIAPADYRDACSKIISDSEKESISKWQQTLPMVVTALSAIILFICIILVIQYTKSTMADANAIHKEALAFYEKTAQRLSAVPTTTAP